MGLQPRDKLIRLAGDQHALNAAGGAANEFHVRDWHVKAVRQQSQQGLVGLAILWHGPHPCAQMAVLAIRAGGAFECVPRGARGEAHGNLQAVFAHCPGRFFDHEKGSEHVGVDIHHDDVAQQHQCQQRDDG